MKIRLKTGKDLKTKNVISVYGHHEGLVPAIIWLASKVLPEDENRECGYTLNRCGENPCAMCHEMIPDGCGDVVMHHIGYIQGSTLPDSNANVVMHVAKVYDTNKYVLTFVKPAWDSAYIITE